MMRDETIAKTYRGGKTVVEIAERDGRSRSTIRTILKNMQIKFRSRGRRPVKGKSYGA